MSSHLPPTPQTGSSQTSSTLSQPTDDPHATTGWNAHEIWRTRIFVAQPKDEAPEPKA
jgi:hypothetical protein